MKKKQNMNNLINKQAAIEALDEQLDDFLRFMLMLIIFAVEQEG